MKICAGPWPAGSKSEAGRKFALGAFSAGSCRPPPEQSPQTLPNLPTRRATAATRKCTVPVRCESRRRLAESWAQRRSRRGRPASFEAPEKLGPGGPPDTAILHDGPWCGSGAKVDSTSRKVGSNDALAEEAPRFPRVRKSWVQGGPAKCRFFVRLAVKLRY